VERSAGTNRNPPDKFRQVCPAGHSVSNEPDQDKKRAGTEQKAEKSKKSFFAKSYP
jgi:hypothetical protein